MVHLYHCHRSCSISDLQDSEEAIQVEVFDIYKSIDYEEGICFNYNRYLGIVDVGWVHCVRRQIDGQVYKGVLTGRLNDKDVTYDVTVDDVGDDFDVDWKLME